MSGSTYLARSHKILISSSRESRLFFQRSKLQSFSTFIYDSWDEFTIRLGPHGYPHQDDHRDFLERGAHLPDGTLPKASEFLFGRVFKPSGRGSPLCAHQRDED